MKIFESETGFLFVCTNNDDICTINKQVGFRNIHSVLNALNKTSGYDDSNIKINSISGTSSEICSFNYPDEIQENYPEYFI